jgi:hypothetical protein
VRRRSDDVVKVLSAENALYEIRGQKISLQGLQCLLGVYQSLPASLGTGGPPSDNHKKEQQSYAYERKENQAYH